MSLGARLKKKLSPVFPCLSGKKEPENCYERLFFRGTKEHYLLRLAISIVLWENFGIMMYYILAIKYATNPGQMGTVVAGVVHLVLTIMFLIPQVQFFLLSITVFFWFNEYGIESCKKSNRAENPTRALQSVPSRSSVDFRV